MKEESARSSPELGPESLTQRRPQPVPLHCLSFASESSAFDRVVSKPAGASRHSLRGYVQPTEPNHPAKLVTSETPENLSEGSWVGSTPAKALFQSPAMKVLEGERMESPDLHICESNAEEDALFAEVLEKNQKTLLALEDHGRLRSHQDPSGNENFGKRAVSLEPWNESQNRSSHPPTHHQPTDRMGRTEMVLYVQNEPVSQEVGVTGPTKEALTKKHKVRIRSLSDYTGPSQLQALRARDPASRRLSAQAVEPPVEAGMLDTRVSVAQLRNAFLESASASRKSKL